MAVVVDSEYASKVPAAKMYEVFLLDSHIQIPKILPNVIKSIDVIEGDGKYKGTKQTVFAEGSGFKYIKHKIDFVDDAKLIYNWTDFGGEPWIEGLDKICYENQVLPNGDGSIIKTKTSFHPKSGCTVDQAKIKELQAKTGEFFQAIEAHILTNP